MDDIVGYETFENQEIICKIFIGDIENRHLKGYVEITTPGEAIIKYALIEVRMLGNKIMVFKKTSRLRKTQQSFGFRIT